MNSRAFRGTATLLASFIAIAAASAQSVELRHNVENDSPYRIVSTNNQTIRLNGQFVRQAQIVGWATIHPVEPGDGTMTYEAEFQLTTTSRRAGEPVEVLDYYESRFTRDRLGTMEVAPRYLMPVARDLPVFPEKAVEPGDTWSALAREVHDLFESYGLDEPLRFSFPVTYRYAGVFEYEGRRLLRIDLSYNIFHRENRYAALYPHMVSGTSMQSLFWDGELGRMVAKEEEYVIVFALSDGQTIEYSGDVTTRIRDLPPLDRPTALERISTEIAAADLANTSVREVPDGVSITLESVGFPPDSAQLLHKEQRRLDRIARILESYPDQAILITGHTALAGTRTGRMNLSVERARAVGQYLLDTGVRSPEEMLFRGVGAEQPIADNSTEEGRRRNRRVEITITDR